MELSGSDAKFGPFLLEGILQHMQVVSEGVEGNAEEELQLLMRGGCSARLWVPERSRVFASPSLGLVEASGE